MEQEMTLDLREIWEIIRKRIWIIVSITLAATIASGILSFFVIKPTYEAKTTVIIGKFPDGVKTEVQYNDVLMFQKLMKTYSEVAKSNTVLEKTADKLGSDIKADRVGKMVSVSPQADTQIMNIKVSSKQPEEAMIVANALTNVFIEESIRLYPTGNVQIMDPAKIPEFPVKPNKKLNLAIAFFLGLMGSLGIVFLIEYMDNTIKTESDVEKFLELPVIGIIPREAE